MKAGEVLVRDLVSLPKLSCSRIPHLRAHILQKDVNISPPKTLGPISFSRTSSIKSTHRCTQRISSREASCPHFNVSRTLRSPPWRSNASLAYPFNSSDEEIDTNPTDTDRATISSSLDTGDAVEGTIASADFSEILQQRHPDRILFAFLSSSIGAQFIHEVDDDTFAQAFCALDPSYFIEPYKPFYRYMKQDVQVMPQFRQVRSFQDRVERFAEILDGIIIQRRHAKGSLTLAIYSHLLKWAASFGDGLMARHVFQNMMPDDGVTPDLESYNNFLRAINWSHAYSAEASFRLRVTPRNLQLRDAKQPPEDLSGYRVGQGGLKSEALKIFRSLVTQGLQGNEATHTELMISLGREGDLPGVQSILKSVWNIDVDMLDKYDEEEIESPTFYEPGSPLQPTRRLLSAIAHAYGYNNDVGLAFTLVDYVSRNCNIEVPENVWAELYDRAFLLSLHRSLSQRKQKQDIGQIDKTVFDRMFRLMTDEPYQIQPNFNMFALRSRSQRDWGLLTGAVEAFRQAKMLLDEHRTELSMYYDEVLSLLPKPTQAEACDESLSIPFLEARRNFVLASLKVEYELQLLIILMRNILKESEWPGSNRRTEWAHRGLPALVGEFQEFLPNSIPYRVPSGKVELECKAHRTRATREANDMQTRKAGIMRIALDTEDPKKLMENIASLPRQMKVSKPYCQSCEEVGHSVIDCRKNRTMWLIEPGKKLPPPDVHKSSWPNRKHTSERPRKRYGFERK